MEHKQIKKIISCIYAVVFIAVLVFIDQWAKWRALLQLKPRQQPLVAIPHILDLTYLENKGAAWGMLQNQQWLFVIIAAVLMVFAAVYYVHLPIEKKYMPLRVLIVLLASGAVGNMIDRITHGFVIDFFEFSFISFPVFNVADVYVTVSVALLAVLILFVYKEEDWMLDFNREKDKTHKKGKEKDE